MVTAHTGFSDVSDFMKETANTVISQQRKDGSFPPARGGVYDTNETPIRTTSEWLLVIAKAYSDTQAEKFRCAANRAADYLLSSERRPDEFTFKFRDEDGKDKCDGIIGQAIPIEALAYSGEVLERQDLIDLAVDIFFLHPFNNRLGLWEAVEVDGRYLSFDRTLNHQTIFAARSAQLTDYNSKIRKRVKEFLQKLPQNVETRDNGVFQHHIHPQMNLVLRMAIKHKRHWKLIWNEFTRPYYAVSPEQQKKEVGYHPTILASLARLHQEFPNHRVWEESQIQQGLAFTKTLVYKQQLRNRASKYGSMIPEFHHALLLSEFDKLSDDQISEWITRGIERTFDSETGLLTRSSADPTHQATLVSQLVHLSNKNI